MSSIGLKRGTVKVIPYDPSWVTAFEAEKDKLLSTIGQHVSAIEHIGSTSVPELAAKPIIDIIATVDDLSAYKQLITPLNALGYEFMPERIFADRVFFPKGPRECRTHHLSLVIKDSKEWTETIGFRDYLKKNTPARQRYQDLKQQLATLYPDDRASYTESKDTIIKELLAEAVVRIPIPRDER